MKRIKAFTLVELLVVIIIIGVLATLVILSLSSSVKKSKDARAKDSIKKIETALTQMASEGTDTLVTKIGTALPTSPDFFMTATTLKSSTDDYFFSTTPKDANNRPIRLQVSGNNYVVYGETSAGATNCWYLKPAASNLDLEKSSTACSTLAP
jgi:general secretion pathway protein G